MTISELIFAKRLVSNDKIQWNLLDVYKVEIGFPIQVQIFGILPQKNVSAGKITELDLYTRPTTGSRRKNLQGLRIPCALVVSKNILVRKKIEGLI